MKTSRDSNQFKPELSDKWHIDEQMVLHLTLCLFGLCNCVDSRSTRPDAGGTIKAIGSVLPEEDFVRIAKDPALDVIEIDFHVPCGYFSSAVALHGFFKELSQKAVEFPEIRDVIFDKIDSIMHGRRVDLDRQSYAYAIHLSHAAEDTFFQLFGPRGDLRKILGHMHAHGVFASKEEGFALKAAASVDKKLARWGIIGLSNLHYNLLVIEEFARMDTAQKAAWLENHRAEIEKERGKGNMPKLAVAVEDYATGRIFLPPAQLTRENAMDTNREDAFLKEQADVSSHVHGGNAAAGH